jgi:hypothetical protein
MTRREWAERGTDTMALIIYCFEGCISYLHGVCWVILFYAFVSRVELVLVQVSPSGASLARSRLLEGVARSTLVLAVIWVEGSVLREEAKCRCTR